MGTDRELTKIVKIRKLTYFGHIISTAFYIWSCNAKQIAKGVQIEGEYDDWKICDNGMEGHQTNY